MMGTMTNCCSHFYVHLDNKQTGVKQKPHQAAFRCDLAQVISLGTNDNSVWKVGLDWLAVPSQLEQIHPGNNLIVVSKKGTEPITFSVPVGTYDPANLAKIITVGVNIRFTLQRKTLVRFNLSFNNISKKMELMSEDLQMYVHHPEMRKMLGLDDPYFPRGENRLKLENRSLPNRPVGFIPSVVLVTSSLVASSSQNVINLPVLSTFTWEEKQGHCNLWKAKLSDPIPLMPVQSHYIKSIEIELRDQDGKILPIFDDDNITLCLMFSKKERQ